MKLNLNYRWMQLALNEAILAEKRCEVPVGAVIINLQNNKLTSLPFQVRNTRICIYI